MLLDYPHAWLWLEGEPKSSIAGFSLTDPSLPCLTSSQVLLCCGKVTPAVTSIFRSRSHFGVCNALVQRYAHRERGETSCVPLPGTELHAADGDCSRLW